MRSRETPSPVNVESTNVYSVWTLPNPDTVTNYGWFGWQWSPFYEVIRDEPKSTWMEYRKGVRRRVFKYVSHRRLALNVESGSCTTHTDANNYWCTSPGLSLLQQMFPSIAPPFEGVDLGKGLCEIALSKVEPAEYGHYDRWQAVKPAMTSRLNLAVSLGELTDIKRMWDILPKKHLGQGTWQDVLNVASWANGLHLNYNFGWKPFLADVVSCVTAKLDFDKRLRKLLHEADKPLMKRFREKPENISETWDVFSTYWTGRKITYSVELKVERTSNFHYAYDLPPMAEDSFRRRAWADFLGLKIGPRLFWELTPMSFVVDWFWDFGKLLGTLDPDWIQPWITWYQSGYSRKVTGVLKAAVGHRKSDGTYAVFPAAELYFSDYARVPALPNFSGATDSLDADKIRLGASLLYALRK